MFTQYLDTIRLCRSAATYQQYAKALAFFNSAEPTMQVITDFLQKENNLSQNTKIDYLKIYIRACKYMGNNPDKQVEMFIKNMKAKKPLQEFATTEQVNTLLEKCDKKMFRAAIGLMAYAGLRIQEVIKLEFKDINFDKGEFIIRNTKNGTDRQCFINDKLKKLLEDYILSYEYESGTYLFNSKVKGKPTGSMYSKVYFENQIKLLCCKCGFNKLHCHAFRRFFATSVYKNSNNNLRLTAAACGHKTITTTMRYIGVDSNEIMAAIQQL